MARLTALPLPLLLLAFAVPSQAQDARAQFERFSQDLQGLEGRFEQHVFEAGGRLSESSSGTVALRAPGQFRWEYVQPFPQLIIADGRQVWIYDPDLEQVTVRPQGAEQQSSPLAALVDPAELDRQFQVSEGGESDGYSWLLLEPRDDEGQFSAARLGFSEAGELARMELDDALGQRTQVAFSGWQRNPGFDPERFRFDPPAGVDVVGEVIQAPEVFPVR